MFRQCSVLLCLATALPAAADPLQGQKGIYMQTRDGTEVQVADITFRPEGSGTTYEIAWKDERFGDFFLSMRPFKCLEGTDKHWCRVPYPYENRRTVSADDLTDLEYDLLFLWKRVNEYGINMWNGIYYRLELDGEQVIGKLHEMDMDILSAPPEDGNLRPVREVDLEPGEPDGHWLPTISIR